MQIIFTDKINRKLFFQRNYSVAWNLPIEERILYFSYSKKSVVRQAFDRTLLSFYGTWNCVNLAMEYQLFASQVTWLNSSGEK